MENDAKINLFKSQKELLDTFLATGAINKAQYDKSLKGLIEKMGIDVHEIQSILKGKE